MTIRFDLPGDISDVLSSDGRDASIAAKEAALVELYRQESISHGQLAKALGISRSEADGVLKTHGVSLDYSLSQLDSDLAYLKGLVRN